MKAISGRTLMFFPCNRETYFRTKTESITLPHAVVKQPTQAEHVMVKSSSPSDLSGTMWILTGRLENRIYSMEKNIWGVKAKYKWM
jgi:hypothetical protein